MGETCSLLMPWVGTPGTQLALPSQQRDRSSLGIKSKRAVQPTIGGWPILKVLLTRDLIKCCMSASWAQWEEDEVGQGMKKC